MRQMAGWIISVLMFALAGGAFGSSPGIVKETGRLILEVRGVDAFHRTADRQALLAELAGAAVRHHEDIGQFVIWGDETMRQALLATGQFEYVEHDWLVAPAQTPDDPHYPIQWHLPHLGAPAAWACMSSQTQFIIGICDTGVDLDHPDLAGVLLPGYNVIDDLPQSEGGDVSDFHGHGTMVIGSAAAIGNNGVGVSGMMWESRILPVRVSSTSGGLAYQSDLLAGARWAADHGARVVSVSYGGVNSPLVNDAGLHLRERGALLVWSAGNDGEYVAMDHPYVTVVGATGYGDLLLSYSNYGPIIDAVAPGIGVYTTRRGGGFDIAGGTSISAPLVAAALAAMWSRSPHLEPHEAERAFLSTLRSIGDPMEYGHGVVDLAAAVCSCPPDVTLNAVVDIDDAERVLLEWGASGEPRWIREDVSGDGLVDAADLFAVLGAWGECW